MSTHRKKFFHAKDYLAEESGAIVKNQKGDPFIALAYPNTYFLGMSNLGFQTLYALFNHDPHAVCERVFLPDTVISGESSDQKTLRTLESGRAVSSADVLAFSISFENDYLYLLHFFHLSGVPHNACDRNESHPIVIAGGAAITINPEPIRRFVDILFVGEADDAVPEILEALRSPGTREQKIAKLATIEGCYAAQDVDFSRIPALPSSICLHSAQPNSLEDRVPLAHLRQYKRRVPQDINGWPIESVIHTPYSEFGKLHLIEVQRGCGRGCKFCAEGFIYTPFRQRDFGLIKEQVLRGLKERNKIGLIGADLLVYPEIIELMDFIHDNGGTFSPSSVRVDAMTPEIIQRLVQSGHRTLAIAPEAGSDELRKNVNKKFNNTSIVSVVDQLISAGIPNIKMYIMIGLPNETANDIEELINLVSAAQDVILTHSRAKGRMVGSLTLSINPFIPKPRTPYQVGFFEGIESLTDKIEHIKKMLFKKGGVKIYYENPFFAYIQALLSNGKTQLSDFLIEVHRNNGSLKKSLRPFLLNQKSAANWE